MLCLADAGVDGVSLDMHNVVDIRSVNNREIALRIHTDIANSDRVFYTDLNGFQVCRVRPPWGEIRCACELTKKAVVVVVGEEHLSARTDSVYLGRSG